MSCDTVKTSNNLFSKTLHRIDAILQQWRSNPSRNHSSNFGIGVKKGGAVKKNKFCILNADMEGNAMVTFFQLASKFFGEEGVKISIRRTF